MRLPRLTPAVTKVLAAVTLVTIGISAQDAGAPRQASKRPLTVKISPIDPTTDEQIKILGNSSAGPKTLNAFKVWIDEFKDPGLKAVT